MNEDIISVILQAEKEYHDIMHNVMKLAETYEEDSKKKQTAFIDTLKQNWIKFEASENEKLINTLAENEKALEIKMADLKNHLNMRQKKMADLISERLKEEVVSLYGNS